MRVNFVGGVDSFGSRSKTVVSHGTLGSLCVFCGEQDSSKFRNESHLIPRAISSVNIITSHECDVCNSKFGGGIESSLMELLILPRIFSGQTGRKSTLKHKHMRSGNFVSTEKGSGVVSFNCSVGDQYPFVDVFDGFMEIRDEVFFSLQDVCRALVKIGFLSSPEFFLRHNECLASIRDWLDIPNPNLRSGARIPLGIQWVGGMGEHAFSYVFELPDANVFCFCIGAVNCVLMTFIPFPVRRVMDGDWIDLVNGFYGGFWRDVWDRFHVGTGGVLDFSKPMGFRVSDDFDPSRQEVKVNVSISEFDRLVDSGIIEPTPPSPAPAADDTPGSS